MTKMRYVALAAVTVLLGACAASTQSTAPQAEPVQMAASEKAAMSTDQKADVYNEAVAKEDRVYCRKEVVTGSHRKRTVCRTAAETEQEAEAARDALWGARSGAATDPGGAN